MGLFNWIGRRIFSDENLGYMLEKVRPMLQQEIDTHLKEAVIHLMEDEDIAYGVGQYADALYSRISQKFFGAIGGKQRGINNIVGNAQDDILGDIFQDGQFNLMGVIRLLMSGKLKQLGSDRPRGLTRIPEHMR